MREIKFRAWATVPKSMYYDVSYNFGFKGEVLQDTVVYELNHLIELMGKVYTLMQYTGFKDKNGKEIWEGDIVVEWEDDMEKLERFVVEWCGEDGYPAFDLKPNHFEEINALSFYAQNGEGYEIEVIGNIYENPELLNAPHQHPQN